MPDTGPSDRRKLSAAAMQDAVGVVVEAIALVLRRRHRKKFRRLVSLLLDSPTDNPEVRADSAAFVLRLLKVSDRLSRKLHPDKRRPLTRR